jgi:hypothetical protein
VPNEFKRPEDEFYDLTSLNAFTEQEVTLDKGIYKYVIEEGKGALIGEKDEVFYKHEARYDSG